MIAGKPGTPPKDGLTLRVLSAALMVPAGLLVVFVGGWILTAAAVLVGLVMLREFWSVTRRDNFPSVSFILACLTLMVFCVWVTAGGDNQKAILGAGVAAVGIAIALERRGHFVWMIAGYIIISAAILSLLLIRNQTTGGLTLAIAVMVCVWSSDIAAYFAGRGFGGPKLAPTDSPNKTWSGAAGAVICTALIGALIAGILRTPIVNWLLFALALSLVCQVGDLLQSRWKRRFNVKDSGALIPGHGGVLDRLDSLSISLIFTASLLLMAPGFPEVFLGLDGA
jgi:phosphatidate cytidylyltransferase